jgi:uncharacterized damage-inducible protein DinB
MTEHLTLAPFYDGWERQLRLLMKAIQPLTADELAITADRYRATWRIAAHIAGNHVYYFQTIMGEGDPALAEFFAWDEGDADTPPPRSSEELIRALTATWRMIESCVQQWTPTMLDDRFPITRGERSFEVTRQWVIWRVLAHDIHHIGEIPLTLGNHGLPGIVA